MKTGTVYIIDGKYTDQFALGEIDATHVYLKLFTGKKPSEIEIENGHVFHVAQLKGMGDGLYDVVMEWLSGARELENVGFTR